MDAQRKPRGPTMGKQIVTAKFIQREPLVSLIQVTSFLIVVQFQRSIYGFWFLKIQCVDNCQDKKFYNVMVKNYSINAIINAKFKNYTEN